MADPTSKEVFARLAAGNVTTPVNPEPPFPKMPPQIKTKFPDLMQYFEQWEKAIEDWQKQKQTAQPAT